APHASQPRPCPGALLPWPISLNWFDELSSEAPPYESETSEEPEYRDGWLDQSTSKTPRGKPSTYSQLASTPMIFKEQSTTLLLLSSPIKELGKDSLVSKEHRTSPQVMKTKLDQTNEIFPLNTSLSTRYVVVVMTPKCISESLGAEVDPDMSWSSSLATPPTLNATVIIGNTKMCAVSRLTCLVLHNFFSSHELEKMLDGSFGEMNTLEDRIHIPIKSSGNQMAPNTPKDGKMHEMTIDIPDGEGHVLSVCRTSGKRGSLQEMTTSNWTKKTHFDKMTTVLFQETNEVRENFEDACFIRCERQLDYPAWELFTTNIPNNRIQKPLENRRFTGEDMPSSLTPEWSQLNLSGVDVTQLEKMSTCDTCSPSCFFSKKRSEDKLALMTRKHANFSTLETSLLNTSSLIKAEKLLNITLSEDVENEKETHEKHSTSETFLTHSVVLSGQDSPLKKGCAEKKVSKVNFLDSSSFLRKNTNFTEYPQIHNSCFHKHLKECSKASITDVTSHPLVCNASTANNPAGSKCVLSRLIKKPKRFIYTINSVSPYHEEKVQKEIKAGFSIHSPSSHSEFESCNFKGTTNNDDRDLLVSSAERNHLGSVTGEKATLLNKYAKRADRIDNSLVSAFNNRMAHENLKDELKDNRKEHQPASSLDCSETSNTQKEYLMVSSNSKSVLSIKHKVIATACLLAKKHSQMDFGEIEDVDQPGELSSDDSEHLIKMEQEGVSMKNCNFSDTWSEINLDISKHNSVSCNKKKSDEENDVTNHLPVEQCKAVTLSPLVIQPDKNSNTKLNRKSKTDIVPFSKVIAADHETESTENDENKLQIDTNKNVVVIEGVKNLFDHKDCNTLQVVISKKSTLPELYLSKKVPQPNVEDKHCLKKVITFPSKHIASDKDLHSKKPLCLDIKSKGNPEDTGKWSGHASFNDHRLKESFGGFQTASNKQIKLSEKSITKGKILFKDIEQEFVDNKLDINYSCGSDSQGSLVKPQNAQGILSESTDSSLQNLPRNQQSQLNQTLTASQEAEITELSNILEETDSQFEFTQFRKQNDMVQNNSSQLSGYVDTNETTHLKSISDTWQEADFIESFETKVQRIIPAQDSFSNFGGFSSAGGKKIDISNEVLIRSAKLFSNVEEDGEMFKSTDKSLRSGYSQRLMTSCKNVSKCETEKGDCGESIKDANTEYQNTLKNNEENINKFMKIYTEKQAKKLRNIDENVHISTSTRTNNLKVIKYSIHKMENALSFSENQNHSLNISKKLNEIDTQTPYNSQEGLSDLTCLSEASKTEEMLTSNILKETELCLDKNEQRKKHLDDFQTASISNISVSQSPVDQLCVFVETCPEKESDNISLKSGSQMTNNINKKIIDVTSVEKNINVNQKISKTSSNHQKISIRQDTDFEIKNIKPNNMTGFHTASGKKVTITDDSLSKAKQIFAEENVFLENKHNIGNFEDFEFQDFKKEKCNKDFIKDCDLFAESIPKYKKMFNLTGNLVSTELEDPSKRIFDDSLIIKQPVDAETLKKLSGEIFVKATADCHIFTVGARRAAPSSWSPWKF
uniref:Tower domain-containing protein n=1 Tax=Pelusios castaneus TaxID=367368 RepID=A0A8C8RV24_9SAUR